MLSMQTKVSESHSGIIYQIPKCPYGSDDKEHTCNAGDVGSIPKLGWFLWRRAWQPAPVFLPRESPWTEEPGGL